MIVRRAWCGMARSLPRLRKSASRGKKFDAGFPAHAIQLLSPEAGNIPLNDLKYVAFYDKPLIKFERLLETYVAFSPKGITSFLAAMPVWLKEKLLLKSFLAERIGVSGRCRQKVRAASNSFR